MTVEQVVYKYSNMLYRICLVILGNEYDTQDALQDTFYRYMKKHPEFQDEEHEKAWLIRVATNICHDIHRFYLRHPQVSIETISEYATTPEEKQVLKELAELPEKLKMVIYLHYIEGYPIKNIGEILKISEAAVKKRLQRGREQLKLQIEN